MLLAITSMVSAMFPTGQESKSHEREDSMGKFFSQLISQALISEWANTLDWLLDDARFSAENGWEQGKVGNFTKKVKKLPGFPKNFAVGTSKELKLKSIKTVWKAVNGPVVKIIRGDSEGKDLIRHIRNGIAHGRTEMHPVGSEVYIEIFDYNSKKQRTAYVLLPLSYIPKLYQIYHEIEKGMQQSRKPKYKST